jgi:hypothetical protein
LIFFLSQILISCRKYGERDFLEELKGKGIIYSWKALINMSLGAEISNNYRIDTPSLLLPFTFFHFLIISTRLWTFTRTISLNTKFPLSTIQSSLSLLVSGGAFTCMAHGNILETHLHDKSSVFRFRFCWRSNVNDIFKLHPIAKSSFYGNT